MKTKSQVVFLIIYVDDILVIGNNNKLIKQLVQRLNGTFGLKDLGSLHYFLGIEVKKDETGLFLS